MVLIIYRAVLLSKYFVNNLIIIIYKVTWGNSATLSRIITFFFCKCVGIKL